MFCANESANIHSAVMTVAPQPRVSAISHVSAERFLSRMLGVDVQVNRVAVAMWAGDSALVLRLTRRLPECVLLSDAELAAWPFELAALTRLS